MTIDNEAAWAALGDLINDKINNLANSGNNLLELLRKENTMSKALVDQPLIQDILREIDSIKPYKANVLLLGSDRFMEFTKLTHIENFFDRFSKPEHVALGYRGQFMGMMVWETIKCPDKIIVLPDFAVIAKENLLVVHRGLTVPKHQGENITAQNVEAKVTTKRSDDTAPSKPFVDPFADVNWR